MPKASQARKTSPDNGAQDSASPAQVAAYVAQTTGELAAMARASGLADLAYLLEMAQLEAANLSQKAEILG